MPDTLEQPATETQAPPPPEKPAKTAAADPADKIRESVRADHVFWERLDLAKPKPEEKKEELKPGEKKAEAKEGEARAGETKTTEEPEKPAPKRKRRAEVDEDKIIDAVATAAAKSAAAAVRETPRQDQPVTKQQPQDDTATLLKSLPEEYSAHADVLQEMQRKWPEKHGNVIKQLVETAQKEQAYRTAWEKEHPGERFDENSSEHDDFFDGLPDPVDQKDFRVAAREVDKREVVAELRPEIDTLRSEVHQSRKEKEIEPLIAQRAMSTISEVLGAINPEYAKLAGDEASLNKLSEDDPIASDIAYAVATDAIREVADVVRLHSQVVKFDQRNPVHMSIWKVAHDAERDIAALPVRDRLDESQRMFATREEYAAMSPVERSKHWILGQEALITILHGRATEKARTLYKAEQEKLERWAKKRGVTVPNAAKQSPTTTAAAPEPKPAAPAPSVSGQTVLGQGAASTINDNASGWDMFFNRIAKS